MKYSDAELRDLIIKRFKTPTHRCSSNPHWEQAKTWDLRSESCSDHLQITAVLKNGKIEKACFGGHACAIAIASTDLIIDKIIGQDLATVAKIIDQYKKLINHGLNDSALDPAILGNLVAFKNIYRQKNRKACALLVTTGVDELVLGNGK